LADIKALYSEIKGLLDAGRRGVVITTLGRDSVKAVYAEEDLSALKETGQVFYDAAVKALETGTLQYRKDDRGTVTVAEPYCPESRLVVLGGGHIALPLVEFAAKCGFAVTVADDRPAFANRLRFPGGERGALREL
jgi:xanthine dehydrogenase accessory factor